MKIKHLSSKTWQKVCLKKKLLGSDKLLYMYRKPPFKSLVR